MARAKEPRRNQPVSFDRLLRNLPRGSRSSRGVGSQNKAESLRLVSEMIDLAVCPSAVVLFGPNIGIGPMLLEHAVHNVCQLMSRGDNGLLSANPAFDPFVKSTDGTLSATGGLGCHA